MSTAFFNKILKQLDMDPISVQLNVTLASMGHTDVEGTTKVAIGRRRELRGDPQSPVVNQAMVHAWRTSYLQAVHGISGKCALVADRYENQVSKYGYSLKHLRLVRPTLELREFLRYDDVDSE